ncbi:glycosyltransferase, partial [Patescibacteria group bacterium]|nr:glycosyltransferase [Patescibacteria group bacterium]
MEKIVFIMNNFLIGGTEKFLYGLIKNLDKDKFEISIVSTWGSGVLEKDFQTLGLPIYFAGSRGCLSNIFAKIFSVFGTAFRLVVFLKKNKPDIVVTSLYQSDILGIFSSWLVGVKKRIIIQHDVKRLNFFVRIIKKIFAINLATKIIANSN